MYVIQLKPITENSCGAVDGVPGRGRGGAGFVGGKGASEQKSSQTAFLQPFPKPKTVHFPKTPEGL